MLKYPPLSGNLKNGFKICSLTILHYFGGNPVLVLMPKNILPYMIILVLQVSHARQAFRSRMEHQRPNYSRHSPTLLVCLLTLFSRLVRKYLKMGIVTLLPFFHLAKAKLACCENNMAEKQGSRTIFAHRLYPCSTDNESFVCTLFNRG